MALLTDITEHSYDTARLNRMVEALWERITGQSIAHDPEADRSSAAGVAQIVDEARRSTRTSLDGAQALIDFIDGPSAVEAEPARKNTQPRRD
jgi:hypothetical protein